MRFFAWSVCVDTRGPGPSRSRAVLTCEIRRRSSEPGLLACQGNIILGDDAYTPHEEAISPRREARVGREGGKAGGGGRQARVRRKDEAEGGEYTGGEREQGGIQAPKV